MPANHRVVLCADDFGLTEGVSRGILELADQGRISATGVITTCPWAQRLGPDLGRLAGSLGIGLHLNLTTGEPLGRMDGLAPNGTLPAFGELLPKAIAGRLPLHEIAAEIGRQLRAFQEVFGRMPDFVDGHQHVHVLPGIRPTLLAVLAREGRRRPWLRDPSDRIDAIARRRLSMLKAVVVAALALGFRREARAAGFETNAGFSGFSPFDPRIPAATVFERSFLALGRRPVVMCHPGHVDEDLRRLDPVVETRPQELAYLASERFADLLEAAGATLIPQPGRAPGAIDSARPGTEA